MEKTKILIYIFTFHLLITNCNTYNKDRNSSSIGMKKTQKDSKKNSEKTNIINEKLIKNQFKPNLRKTNGFNEKLIKT